jgi:hypothetical protein
MPSRFLLLGPSLLGAALVLGAQVQGAGHPSELLRPLAVVMLGSLGFSLLAWGVTRRLDVGVWISLVATAWLLGRELALVAIGVGLGVLMLQNVRRRRGLAPLPITSALVLAPPIVLAAIASLQLVQSGVVALEDFEPIERAPISGRHAQTDLPNIYVLLLDGYPREDTLIAEFGFDNRAFAEQLRTLGLTPYPESRSEFGGTLQTLASTMLADTAELEPYRTVTDELWAQTRELRRRYLVNVPLMDEFRTEGYRFDYVTSEGGMSEWRGWDRVVDTGHLTDTEALLIQRSPLSGLLGPWITEQFRARAEDSLAAWVSTSRDPSRKISFAHLMPPHLPFLWGEDGRATEPLPCWYGRRCSLHTVIAADVELSLVEYGQRLGWQLDALNRRVSAAVQRVVEADPDAIVVVMSDHGARFSPFSDEQFRSFFAARVPHAPDLFSSNPGPDGLFVRLIDSLRRDVAATAARR